MPLTNISNARIHSVEVKPAPDCTGSASMVRVYLIIPDIAAVGYKTTT